MLRINRTPVPNLRIANNSKFALLFFMITKKFQVTRTSTTSLDWFEQLLMCEYLP